MVQDSVDVHQAEKCGQGQALVSPQTRTFWTLFIHGASAQTVVSISEVDLFPAIQRHSSVITLTSHCLALSLIIHLSYEVQEDSDIKIKKIHTYLFQLPEKAPSFWTSCGYTQR